VSEPALRSRLTSGALDVAADLGGGVLALAFGGVAMLRGRRPLHPDGVTYAATVRTRGGGTSGVPWLDEAGTTRVTLRVSRSMGLPSRWADIYGIAMRIPLSDRHPPSAEPWADLLFASTGDTAYGRFVLQLRHGAAGGPLTTLLPVRAPAGPLLFRLLPAVIGSAPDPGLSGLSDLSLPRSLTLSYAVGSGPWTNVAEVMVGQRDSTRRDRARHDPITAELPGTEPYDVVRRLREPAYRAARHVRPVGDGMAAADPPPSQQKVGRGRAVHRDA
jgi:hypothetical protein